MARYIYKRIIFTDNVEELKEELKNKFGNIFIEDIGGAGSGSFDKAQCILEYNGFNTDKLDAHVSVFIDTINLSKNTQYDCVYICIKDVDRILIDIDYSCCRLNFFNLLNSITNKQIYFIIDIKYKDYVFNQIEEYNKHINRLRSFGEIHNQVIFVDDIEKVKQDVSNKETEMFNELDGSKCKDTKSFYDEVTKQFKFPDYFGRNLDAFDECINDFYWSDAEIIFNYIKNINNILLDDKFEKVIFCNALLNHIVYTDRVFILIDKKDKEYFLEQVKIWNEKYE